MNGLINTTQAVRIDGALSLWLEQELQRQRERIEGQLSAEETAATRARIQLLKEILNLPNLAA